MNLVHLHLLLNHFPTIGFAVGFGVFLVGFVGKSEDLQRSGLIVLVIIALLAIPAYVTGSAAQMVIAGRPGVSDDLMTAHQDAALLAFVFMELAGLAAWIPLWRSSRISNLARWNSSAVLLLSIVTMILMLRAANLGGEIRHPEIVSTARTDQSE